MGKEKIKVLVVDDSALIRHLLTQIINSQVDMICVGAATDPLMARQMIKDFNPDVLTLDIEMPKMDGMDFLEKIMRLRPMPVLMVSTLTERGSETALRALELGAVDFVAKPKMNVQDSFVDYEEEIAEKIRMAARACMFMRGEAHSPVNIQQSTSTTVRKVSGKKKDLIAVGASTGGTEAIKVFLLGMPKDSPGIVIVQHMPPAFTKSFANRLNTVCTHLEVKEAEEGDRVLPGHVYIAPGGQHLSVKRFESGYVCRLSHDAPVNRHCPSVEVLFNSIADGLAQHAIGVMLTGMGKDGAEAMMNMRRAGSYNFAQDEASCVVYGMPREAVAYGGVHESVPINHMAEKVVEQL